MCKYVITSSCKWKLFWKLLSTKDGKGMPKALCSNFGPIEAIETSAACSFNSCKKKYNASLFYESNNVDIKEKKNAER